MQDRGHTGQGTGSRIARVVHSRSAILWGLTFITLALAAAGCNGGPFLSSQWPSLERTDAWGGFEIVPRSGGQPVALAADDVIQVMRHIGFNDEQIMQLGPRLRDALRTAGAAVVVRGKRAEVMVASNEGFLFVQSADRGSFIYDIEDKLFAAVPAMPAR